MILQSQRHHHRCRRRRRHRRVDHQHGRQSITQSTTTTAAAAAMPTLLLQHATSTINYMLIVVVLFLLSSSTAQQETTDDRDYKCLIAQDYASTNACTTTSNGVCDDPYWGEGSGSEACRQQDCMDCNIHCKAFAADCYGCMNAKGCYYCPGDSTCENSDMYSSPNGNRMCNSPLEYYSNTYGETAEEKCSNIPGAYYDDPLWEAANWVYEAINVQRVWEEYNLEGTGITIRINDDGVDVSNIEFDGRFDDVANSCVTYLPEDRDTDGHGTNVAGIILANSNNDVCAAGIASKAKFSSCNFFAANVPYSSLAYKLDTFDISQNSIGMPACSNDGLTGTEAIVREYDVCPFVYVDEIDRRFQPPCEVCTDPATGKFMPLLSTQCEDVITDHCKKYYKNDPDACRDFPELVIGGSCDYNKLPTPAVQALELGVTTGRDGKGTIFVFASGNDFAIGDDVNYSGWTNSRFTVTVGAIGKNGKHADYSTPGSALVVTAPGGGSKDVGHLMTAGIGRNTCADSGQGTSFACPVVSAVIALVLEARPDLTWRDVQGILAQTSRRVLNDQDDISIVVNGAGFWHSRWYGFGVVNAFEAVTAAMEWELWTEEEQVIGMSGLVNAPISDDLDNSYVSSIDITKEDSPEDFITESTVVLLDLEHNHRGDLELILTSPDGTQSLLHPGKVPESSDLQDDERWKLMTVRNWGENPIGSWSLTVRDLVNRDGDTIVLLNAADGDVVDTGGTQENVFRQWKLVAYGRSATLAAADNDSDDNEGEQDMAAVDNTFCMDQKNGIPLMINNCDLTPEGNSACPRGTTLTSGDDVVTIDANILCPIDITFEMDYVEASQKGLCGCDLHLFDGDCNLISDEELECQCFACPSGSALGASYSCNQVIARECTSFDCDGNCNGPYQLPLFDGEIPSAPTIPPTKAPVEPTAPPTMQPTKEPTNLPTNLPTTPPTGSPTKKPTRPPTKSPTISPTPEPTKADVINTNPPTASPTKKPTKSPTKSPTISPSSEPTKEDVIIINPEPTELPTKVIQTTEATGGGGGGGEGSAAGILEDSQTVSPIPSGQPVIGQPVMQPVGGNDTITENFACDQGLAVDAGWKVEASITTFFPVVVDGINNNGNDDFCLTGLETNGGWYEMDGNGKIFTITACSVDSSKSLGVHVFTGRGALCTDLTCIENQEQQRPDCGDIDGSGFATSFVSVIGHTYHVLVSGLPFGVGSSRVANNFGSTSRRRLDESNEDTYDYELKVTEEEVPTNTACSLSSPAQFQNNIEGNTVSDETVATLHDTCDNTERSGVWYTLSEGTPESVGSGVLVYQANSCSDATNFNNEISVFRGDDCESLQCVNVEKLPCQLGRFGQMAYWTTSEEEIFHVFVHGGSNEGTAVKTYDAGKFQLDISYADRKVNDQCTGAIEIDLNADVNGTTSGARPDLNSIDDSTCENGGAGAWYSIVGNGSTFQASTCMDQTDHQTTLYVYSGGCAGLFCIDNEGGNSNLCDLSQGAGKSATVNFATQEGVTYYILVTGRRASTGNFGLKVTEIETSSNNECASGEVLALDGNVAGSTLQSTVDFPPNTICGVALDSGGVWYTVDGTGDGLEVRVCGDDKFNAAVSVFKGPSCTELECVTGTAATSSGPQCNNGSVAAAWLSESNTQYSVYVHGNPTKLNNIGEFTISSEGFQVVTSNEFCPGANVVPVNGERIQGSTEDATHAAVSTSTCGPEIGRPGLWYTFEGTGQPYTIYACAEDEDDFDVSASIFTGSCDDLTCVSGSTFVDNTCSSNSQRRNLQEQSRNDFRFMTTFGTDYYVFVHGQNGDGDFELYINENSVEGYGTEAPTPVVGKHGKDLYRWIPVNNEIIIVTDYSSLTILSEPSDGGTATTTGSAILYTPPLDYVGTDFIVVDGCRGPDCYIFDVTIRIMGDNTVYDNDGNRVGVDDDEGWNKLWLLMLLLIIPLCIVPILLYFFWYRKRNEDDADDSEDSSESEKEVWFDDYFDPEGGNQKDSSDEEDWDSDDDSNDDDSDEDDDDDSDEDDSDDEDDGESDESSEPDDDYDDEDDGESDESSEPDDNDEDSFNNEPSSGRKQRR